MTLRVKSHPKHDRTVDFDSVKKQVRLIDQRLLPHSYRILATKDYRETAWAIREMVVRGAGAIGATAAFGLAQAALSFSGHSPSQFNALIRKAEETLARARPTAIDPVNALRAVQAMMAPGKSIVEKQSLALKAARKFADDDVTECEAIGRHGIKLIQAGMRILTHCNAGRLAFVDVGSATAPLYAAHQAGKRFHVFCDETRPRCQGATLTAWELTQEGISHEVIADNASGHLMQRKEVDLVIVGADRVLGRTGEVANKIGTYTKAILARHHGIPFYVAIPLSTIDWQLKRGSDIPIEERDAAEVLGAWGLPSKSEKATHGGTRGSARTYVRIANPGSSARNPGFDVTPAELITGLITPVGILLPTRLWSERPRLKV